VAALVLHDVLEAAERAEAFTGGGRKANTMASLIDIMSCPRSRSMTACAECSAPRRSRRA
jgi:hypothetical protein